MEKLLREIVRRILKAMNLGACEIWLLEGEKFLVPKVGIGIPKKVAETVKLEVGEGLSGYVFKEGKVLAVSDVSQDSREAEKSIARQGKFHSYLGAPIIIGQEKIGVLSLYKKSIHHFAQTEIDLFNALASQAGLAIANALLYDKAKRQLKRKIEELQALYEVGQTVTSTLDIKNVLLLITTTATHIMGVDVATIRLLHQRKKELILGAYVGLSESYKLKRRIKVGESVAGMVAKKKKPLVIKNIKNDKRYSHAALAMEEGLISLMSVPLIKGSQTLGVLSVYTKEERNFTREDVGLLTMFASQAAIAIENARLFREMRTGYLNTIRALAAVIDAKDLYTHGHSEKVMEYAVAIAREMHLSEEEIRVIQYASFLHDLGKISISTNILQKPGRLTAEEFASITEHPRLGSGIVEQVSFLKNLAPIILHHHEHYNGKGYPSGLKKKAIPIGARILGAADAYEAMISDRPYHRAFSKGAAIEELKKCRGAQFDPEVVDAFLEILAKEK